MKKFEYSFLDNYQVSKYASYPDGPLAYALQRALNALGEEGWQVIHFNIDSAMSDVQILVMREKVGGDE